MARILLVDDDPGFGAVFTQALTKSGYAVHHVANGKLALEYLREHECELVMTDIIMPEMDGIELIARMKREFPGPRIVAMTGGGLMESGDYLQTAKLMGANASLSKPCSIELLLETVKSALK
jgi:CheY-like chemotaxis protein